MTKTCVALIPLALSIAAGTALAHPPWYTVRDISAPSVGQPVGQLYALSINDLGQVVGYCYDVLGNKHAYINLKTPAYGFPAGSTALPDNGSPNSEATGINNSGQVSGSVFSNWQDVARWNLAVSPNPEVLMPQGITLCINNSGMIGGTAYPVGFGCFTAGVVSGMGSVAQVTNTECSASVFGINSAGMVVGRGFTASNKGFVALPPAYVGVELPNFAGVSGQSFYTRANAVNDLGQVTGQVHHPTLLTVAMIYEDLNGNGVPDPATEYTILSTPASGTCEGFAINNKGEVVGGRASTGSAMLWRNGKEYDLNQCVVRVGGLYPFLRSADDINEKGQILCKALTTEGERAVVLSPCYANCDGSTTSPQKTANDFICFLTKWAEGSSYANCDDSIGDPLLTANDFQCFINAFASTCP